MSAKIDHFLAEHRPATPCLVLDLDVVEANYRALAAALPEARIYYAVKANPAPLVLKRLANLGARFDAASIQEIAMVLAAGGTPDRISYGNTIKKEADIAWAYGQGVRLFTFDAGEELEKLARAAPGSRVVCRILTSCEGAEWPLSRKFGCDGPMAHDLLRRARESGLVPWGLSFHVGSQQRNPGQWDAALSAAAAVTRALAEDGVFLKLLNLGGGFPTRYRSQVPDVSVYGDAIHAALDRHFPGRSMEILVEPGRGVVGNAGEIATEVVLIARKSATDERRWVFLDIGKFGGLAETMDEAIHYAITSHRTGPAEPVILAGPTCDSTDVLYERTGYLLPADLQIGDILRIRAAGAYTTTYASTGFNGFPPLREYYI